MPAQIAADHKAEHRTGRSLCENTAKQNRRARLRRAVPGESEQEEHRERETGEALDHVDTHEPPNLAAGCEVGGEDRGTAAQRQGERRDAQAARSQRLVQPRIRDPFAPEQEGCPGQHGADRAEAEAMRQRAAYPVQTAAAVFLGTEVHRGDARTGEAERDRRRLHGEHELQKSDARRADAPREIDLKHHRHAAQQEIHPGQQQRIVEDRPFPHPDAPLFLKSVYAGDGQGRSG